jgi:hypothetical protein
MAGSKRQALDVVERVFAGHAQQIAVSLPEPEAVMVRWKRAERRSPTTMKRNTGPSAGSTGPARGPHRRTGRSGRCR